MGGRVYTTTTVRIGGTKIEVRQPIFKGNENVPQAVGELVRVARSWLGLALMKLSPTGFTRDVRAGRGRMDFDPRVFSTLFKQEPSSASLNTVRQVLSTISSGMSFGFGIKVRESSARGYVNPYYPMFSNLSLRQVGLSQRKFGNCSQADGTLWYDKDDDLLHSKGEIHLKLDILSQGPDAVRTLIHEAGHKFANLWDIAYVWQKEKFEAMKPEQALRNADSYAHFVKALAMKTQERADRRAAAANVDALDGLADLFS